MSENETKKDDQPELAEDQLETVVGGVAQVGLNVVGQRSPKSPSRFGDTPGLNGGDMLIKASDD